jgi:hypothetical protein
VSRLLIRLGAADESILQTCPLRDVHNVMTIGWLLVIVWLWQSILFAMVGHMMLACSSEWRLDLVEGAMLIATVVLLVDSHVIVRSSWRLQDLSELKRGGLDLPSPIGPDQEREADGPSGRRETSPSAIRLVPVPDCGARHEGTCNEGDRWMPLHV